MPLALPSAAADSNAPQQNLIRNGDFEEGLAYWSKGVISTRGEEYPDIKVVSEDGNHYLSMDVPEPSAGYVEQGGIRIPQGAHAILSMKVWGVTALTEVRVLALDPASGRSDLIDSFYLSLGLRTHRAYNFTAYSGRMITLRIVASGLTNTGSFAMLDDIVLVASYSNHSIITLDVSDRGIFAYQTGFAPANNLLIAKGIIIPAPNVPVPVHIEFTGPQGSSNTTTTLTDREGRYTLSVNFTSPGIWTVRSYWNGTKEYLGAVSTQREFAVGKPVELQIQGCTVRDLPIDNLNDPTFEVKPGENITASFTIFMEESWVLTNVYAVVLASWEPDKWAIISFQWGWNTEPLYYKQVYVAPDKSFRPVRRNPLTGSYEVNATIDIPLRGDYYMEITTNETGAYGERGDVPSFTAPSSEGTYYVGFLMSEVMSAHDVVNEQKVWTQGPDYFEKLVPSNRTTRHIQFVRVIVVDVDGPMKDAGDAIARAKRNFVEVDGEERTYSEALDEYGRGHYSKAKALALTAHESVVRKLAILEQEVKSRDFAVWMSFLLSTNVVSRTEIVSTDYEKFGEQESEDNYGQAKLLADRLQAQTFSDLFFYLGLAMIMLFAIGDVTGWILGKVNLVEALSSLIKSLFPQKKRRRSRVSPKLAALAAILLFAVVETVLFFASGYPPVGSALLGACAVGGGQLRFTSRAVRVIRRI
jgi:hypothetical protein